MIFMACHGGPGSLACGLFAPILSSSPLMSSVATPTSIPNRGWTVTFAGLGINLALGDLYAWSLFKAAIAKELGWQGEQLNDLYALCCVVFAITMVFAGRFQDKLGPRLTATLGGLLIGA